MPLHNLVKSELFYLLESWRYEQNKGAEYPKSKLDTKMSVRRHTKNTFFQQQKLKLKKKKKNFLKKREIKNAILLVFQY